MPGWQTFLRRQAVPAGTAGTARATLPARLRDLVQQQENRSERLIGWVQLAVVTSFALLYSIAPHPEDAPERVLFDPVLVVLLLYGAFTVGRLALAYYWRLPSPLLILSILADIGLLITLIWAFHERYGQTPPFSLKAPTFVYMFVFIALRTLRFDHRYVLLAGIFRGRRLARPRRRRAEDGRDRRSSRAALSPTSIPTASCLAPSTTKCSRCCW